MGNELSEYYPAGHGRRRTGLELRQYVARPPLAS